jgi:hypothetical protein
LADPNIVEQIYEVLSQPMDLPSTFWDYATQNWLKDAPVFPISQVFGFTGFVFQPAVLIGTTENVTSTTYTDLATVGPTLSGLADGNYAIFFGAALIPATGDAAFASVQVNSTPAVDADEIVVAVAAATPGVDVSTSRLLLKSLSNGNQNTLTMKYRCQTTSAQFGSRWLVAIKYANL